jgi:hypothetical protein
VPDPGDPAGVARGGREATQLIGEDLSLGEPVADGLPVLGVEVSLARSREMALTDEDIDIRRTRLSTLGLTPSAGPRQG